MSETALFVSEIALFRYLYCILLLFIIKSIQVQNAVQGRAHFVLCQSCYPSDDKKSLPCSFEHGSDFLWDYISVTKLFEFRHIRYINDLAFCRNNTAFTQSFQCTGKA